MNINQNHSGVGDNIINFNSQDRHIDIILKYDLLKSLRGVNFNKDKKIFITCNLGDSEAIRYGNEIYSFLKKEGYNVDGVNQFTFPPKDLENGVNVEMYSRHDGDIDLIVWPRRN